MAALKGPNFGFVNHWQYLSGTSQDILDGVAGNASAASRTIELDCRELTDVSVFLQLVRDSYTAVTVSVEMAGDDSGSYGAVKSIAISSGVGTLSTYTLTETTAVDWTATLDFPVDGKTFVKLIITLTDGGASDTITAQATGASVRGGR